MQLRLLLDCGYRTSPLRVMTDSRTLASQSLENDGLEPFWDFSRTILATLEGYCLLTRTGLGESAGIEPTTHRL